MVGGGGGRERGEERTIDYWFCRSGKSFNPNYRYHPPQSIVFFVFFWGGGGLVFKSTMSILHNICFREKLGEN